MTGVVEAVSVSPTHTMRKENQPGIRLLTGLGVVGDAHAGETVKHRSRVRRDPTQPNLRQVHLVHAELLDELRASGFALQPGRIGENVTTRGIDLLGLPTGTRLRLGAAAVVEVTGLPRSSVPVSVTVRPARPSPASGVPLPLPSPKASPLIPPRHRK